MIFLSKIISMDDRNRERLFSKPQKFGLRIMQKIKY